MIDIELKPSLYDLESMGRLPHMCTRSKIILSNHKNSISKHFELESLQGYLKKDYILDWLTMNPGNYSKDPINSFIETIQINKAKYVNSFTEYFKLRFDGIHINNLNYILM